MDRDELYEILDIESGEDFQYFENFADLAETGEDIDDDALYGLFKEMDMKTFAELCESFFYETEDSIPEDENDLVMLAENIKRCLVGMSEAVTRDEDNSLIKLSDEFNRFRRWYSADLNAEYRDTDTGETTICTVRDALTLARMEKIGGERYQYDFSKALDYVIDEYAMTYADMNDE